MEIKTKCFVLLALLFGACQPSTPKNEEQEAKVFTSKEVGWSIEIPQGFKVLSQNRVKENEQKGRAAMELTNGKKVQTSNLITLLNFQKNQFNSFSATLQPYDEKIDGNYLASYELTKKAIYNTYTQQKIKIDTTSFQETVAGKAFYGFSIKIYGPNGDVIMDQLMMSQLRNGYDFGININYNNTNDYQKLWSTFKNAKYSN